MNGNHHRAFDASPSMCLRSTAHPENVICLLADEFPPAHVNLFSPAALGLESLAAGDARTEGVPPRQAQWFAALPAQEDLLAVTHRGKVDQTRADVAQGHALRVNLLGDGLELRLNRLLLVRGLVDAFVAAKDLAVHRDAARARWVELIQTREQPLGSCQQAVDFGQQRLGLGGSEVAPCLLMTPAHRKPSHRSCAFLGAAQWAPIEYKECAPMTEQELLAALREIDTPTITNVVATYPTNPLCLGLYNPWTENWYTDTSIRCIYPELGPVVGYAVTCVYGMPDPNYPNRLTYQDVIEALDASPKPTVLVIQQKWPPDIFNKAGLAGEIMTTTAMAVGCVGLLSNGPSRDIDAIRRNKFQMLLGGVTPGHGAMGVMAVQVPVSVGGMDVAPGELIHMDENGAVKFPPSTMQQVVTNARAMLDHEAALLERLRHAKTAAEVRAASTESTYLEKKP